MKNALIECITVFLAISLISLALTLCKSPLGKNEKWISNAENLIWENPDSALSLLNLVDTARLNKHQKAVYTLLYTQAMDKTNGDITGRSEVFGLKDFFERTGDFDHAALAAFYEGRIFEEIDNAHDAMQAYLNAAEIAHSLANQDRLKGLIESHTGDLYYARIETTEAMKHYRKASKHFRLAGDNVSEMVSLNSIGCSQLLNNTYDSALYYFSKVTEIPAYHDHQKLQVSILQNIGIISQYEDNPQKARDLFLQALHQNTDKQVEAYLYICLSQAYHDLLRPDSASYFMEHALKLCEQMPDPPMASIYKTLIQMEKRKGNDGEALENAQKQIDYLQNTYEKYLNQQLSEAERKFQFEVERNKNNQLTIKRKNDLITFLIVLSVFLVVLVLLSIFYTNLKKSIVKKEQTITTLSKEIEGHMNHTNYLEKEIKQNQETIQQLKGEKSLGNKEENEVIDEKIKTKEEYAGQLEEQLRLTYSYMLKSHLEICKKYDYFKLGLIMSKHSETIQLTDKFFYGETGKINWETVLPFIPTKFEEKIMRRYQKLNINETRLCCLLLFDVSKYDIVRILPYVKNSLSPTTFRIREKTGMKDIKKDLTPLLH